MSKSMTEYDRTPIEVADMRNGDLIARSLGAAYTFIGKHPRDQLDFYVLTSAGAVTNYQDIGGWYKLTPKPAPVRCKHCGEEINLDLGGSWYHQSIRTNQRWPGRARCALYATPATESETA